MKFEYVVYFRLFFQNKNKVEAQKCLSYRLKHAFFQAYDFLNSKVHQNLGSYPLIIKKNNPKVTISNLEKFGDISL